MLGEIRAASGARTLRYLSFPHRSDMQAPDGWKLVGAETIAAAETSSLDVDAVMITGEVSEVMMDRLFERLADPLVPVVSLNGEARRGTDQGGESPWGMARSIIERREELPQAIRQSGRVEDVLLARMFTRKSDLHPRYTPGDRNSVSYPVAGRIDGVAEAANRLVDAGLLTRKFFDRLHTCPSCSSSALNVREECHKCRSADLHVQEIVHHFRCGHQAPVSKFESPLGHALTCPKCNLKLRHIGLDYDKPGSVQTCRSCAHTDDSNAVGFVCMHCEGKFDAARVPVRDVYSYAITAQGTRMLFGGQPDVVSQPPNVFTVLLHSAVQQEATLKQPFQIIQGAFTNLEAGRSEQPHHWDKGIRLVLDALGQAVRDVDTVTVEPDGFYVLMPAATPKQAKHYAADIKKALDAVIDLKLGLDCSVLNREEVAALVKEKLGR